MSTDGWRLPSLWGCALIFLLAPTPYDRLASEELLPRAHRLYSILGNEIDIDDIKEVIGNLEDHVEDIGLENIISSGRIINDISPAALAACGHDEEFEDFFRVHSFEVRILTKDEWSFLRRCVESVLESIEQKYNFTAPGFLQRYSMRSVDSIITSAYQCGYRTKRLLTYYSLAVWLRGQDAIKNDPRFRCLGDITSESSYAEEDFLWAIRSIVGEVIFLEEAFNDWRDVLTYLTYKDLVLGNRATAVCREIYEDYEPNDPIFSELVEGNSCDTIEYRYKVGAGEQR